MENKTPIENIKLSFNCDKEYDKMTPCSLGRHCSSCDKTVIDFRKKKLSELIISLEEHGTVCGLFAKEQTLKTEKYFIKFRRVAASILFALGLGFFNKELKAQNTTYDTLTQENSFSEMTVGMIIETMPTFKDGGDKGLEKFLKKNLKYPKDSIEGKVYVSFTIDTTGKVIDPKIIRSLSTETDKEVLRVVKLLEFIPGTQRGRKKRVPYTLPVSFSKKK